MNLHQLAARPVRPSAGWFVRLVRHRHRRAVVLGGPLRADCAARSAARTGAVRGGSLPGRASAPPLSRRSGPGRLLRRRRNPRKSRGKPGQADLGITAGLQDRVIQTYEGVVYMDFDRSIMESRGHGDYTPLSPALLPRLWLASRGPSSHPLAPWRPTWAGRGPLRS